MFVLALVLALVVVLVVLVLVGGTGVESEVE